MTPALSKDVVDDGIIFNCSRSVYRSKLSVAIPVHLPYDKQTDLFWNRSNLISCNEKHLRKSYCETFKKNIQFLSTLFEEFVTKEINLPEKKTDITGKFVLANPKNISFSVSNDIVNDSLTEAVTQSQSSQLFPDLNSVVSSTMLLYLDRVTVMGTLYAINVACRNRDVFQLPFSFGEIRKQIEQEYLKYSNNTILLQDDVVFHNALECYIANNSLILQVSIPVVLSDVKTYCVNESKIFDYVECKCEYDHFNTISSVDNELFTATYHDCYKDLCHISEKYEKCARYLLNNHETSSYHICMNCLKKEYNICQFDISEALKFIGKLWLFMITYTMGFCFTLWFFLLWEEKRLHRNRFIPTPILRQSNQL